MDRAVVAIVAVALTVRLVLAFAAPLPRVAGDPAVYDEVAVALAAGHGFSRLPREPGARPRPSAVHPPAWPALLGAAYAVTGHDSRDDVRARQRVGRVVQALLGAAAVALIALIAHQLWGRAVALAAAAIAALHPPLTVLGLGLYSEPLFVVLELGALAAVLRFRRAPDLRWAVLAGLLAGLATLTRNNGAVLLLPLAAAVWGGRPRAPVALVAAAALVLAPWTVRNLVAMDAFVPVATNLGRTIAGTYNAESARHYHRWLPERGYLPRDELRRLQAMSEPRRSAELTRDGLRYVADHPRSVPVATAENTARLAELDPVGRNVLAAAVGSRALASVSVAGFALVALLAAAGALTRQARAAPRFVWLVPLLMAASAVPLAVVFSRFRAPIDPFLILLAALAVRGRRGAGGGRSRSILS